MGFEKDVKWIGKEKWLILVTLQLKSIDNSGLVAVSVVRPYVESILKKQEKQS
jgi:hypothetical protein